MSNTYKRRGSTRYRLIIVMAVMLIITGSLVCYGRMVISPAVDDIAKLRAGAMITQMANEAMREHFQGDGNISELLIIKTNNDGDIEMVQSDTKAINRLITDLSAEIQQKYNKMEEVQMSVPIGSLVGNKILSQVGPSVNVKILPISIIAVDFKTEFDTQGINQTKYKVYAVFNSKAKVMAPFSKSTFEISNTVLIAEAVILGKVPASYVNVPKEDLLDVTDE